MDFQEGQKEAGQTQLIRKEFQLEISYFYYEMQRTLTLQLHANPVERERAKDNPS